MVGSSCCLDVLLEDACPMVLVVPFLLMINNVATYFLVELISFCQPRLGCIGLISRFCVLNLMSTLVCDCLT